MKAGLQTTEFYVTAAVASWAAFAPGVPEPWNVIIPAVAGAIYTVARAYLKGKE